MRLRTALVIAGAFLALAIIPSRAADTLPSQLSDAAFWKLISDSSEPDKYQREERPRRVQVIEYRRVWTPKRKIPDQIAVRKSVASAAPRR